VDIHHKIKHRRNAIRSGMFDASKIPSIALIASMMSYGSLARESNLDLNFAIISTAFMWALPGQIALVELHSAGSTLFAAVLAVAMANARFFPMSASMVPLFQRGVKQRLWLYPLSHFITFNSWLWVARRFPDFAEENRVWYFIGFGLVCYISGLAGTIIGFFISDILPAEVLLGLVFLVIIYFIVMLADIRNPLALTAVVCGSIGGPLFHLLHSDLGIMIAGLVGGTVAFFISRPYRNLES